MTELACDADGLSNLCTLLLIGDAGFLPPVKSLLTAAVDGMKLAANSADGDVAVLSARVVALVLEKCASSAARQERLVKSAVEQLLELIGAVPSSSPSPPRRSGSLSRRRSSTSLSGDVAPTAASLLQYRSCLPHELPEETLKCTMIIHNNSAFASTICPPKDVIMSLCHRILECGVSSSVTCAFGIMTQLIRDDGCTDESIRRAFSAGEQALTALAERSDFSPDWDEQLCAATQLLLVAAVHGVSEATQQSLVSACFILCQAASSKGAVTQRLNLVLGCASALITTIGASLTQLRLEDWDWMVSILEKDMAKEGMRRIGNPFVDESTGDGGDTEDGHDEQDNEEDDEGRALANTKWVPEDARISVLRIAAAALGKPITIGAHYVVAWIDGDDTYHRYPQSVADELGAAYVGQPQTKTVPLTFLSRYHSVCLCSLMQVNSHTKVQRRVFLQPIPSPVTQPPTVSLKINEEPEFAALIRSPQRLQTSTQQLARLLPGLTCLATARRSNTLPRGASRLASSLAVLILASRDAFDDEHDAKFMTQIISSYFSLFPLLERCRRIHLLLDNCESWSMVFLRCGVLHDLHRVTDESETTTASGQQTLKKRRVEGHQRREDDATREVKQALQRLETSVNEIALKKAHGSSSGVLGGCPTIRCGDVLEACGEQWEDDTKRDACLDRLKAVIFSDDELTSYLLRFHDVKTWGPVVEAVRREIIPRDVSQRSLVQTLAQCLTHEVHQLSNQPKKLNRDECAATSKLGLCTSSLASRLKCPKGHTLRLHHSSHWKCNDCGRSSSSLASSACRECDYDLCQRCVQKRTPNVVEVSHCATVGDVIRSLRGEGATAPRDDATLRLIHQLSLMVGSSQPLITIDPLIRAFSAREGTTPTLPFGSVPLPAIAFDTQGAFIAPAGATLNQIMMLERGASKKGMNRCSKSCFHVVSMTEPLGGSCSCQADSTRRIESTPEHSALQAGKHSQNASPLLAPLGVAKEGAVSRRGPTLTEMDQLIEVISAMEVSLLPSQAIDVAVVEATELAATDIFFKGVDGLPPLLKRLLQSGCRDVIGILTRRDVLRFCSVDCRRYALLHMFSHDMRVRGIGPTLQTAPVATKFKVHRAPLDTLTNELYQAFQSCPPLRSKVEFTIEGEEGTGEGPTLEVYTEVSHQATGTEKMWYHDTTQNVTILFPSNDTTFQKSFFVLGSCFARSFADGYSMDVSLTPEMWECCLQYDAARRQQYQPLPTADSEEKASPSWLSPLLESIASRVDPLFYKNLVCLRSLDDVMLQEMGVYMDDSDDASIVTIATREAYISQSLKLRFEGCAQNIAAFMLGYGQVLDPSALSMIDTTEMDAVFCGHRNAHDVALFSEEELQQHVVGAHGYTQDSQEVQNLIKIVASLTPLQQSHFIEFLTGSPRLPLGGLAGLNRPITIAKKVLDCGDKTLPSCNTCFLYFKLPPYRTLDIMKERLLVAITEGRKNFSLS